MHIAVAFNLWGYVVANIVLALWENLQLHKAKLVPVNLGCLGLGLVFYA